MSLTDKYTRKTPPRIWEKENATEKKTLVNFLAEKKLRRFQQTEVRQNQLTYWACKTISFINILPKLPILNPILVSHSLERHY